MRSKYKVRASRSPLGAARLPILAGKDLTASGRVGCPDGADIQEVLEEVVGKNTRLRGEDSVLGSIVISVEGTQATRKDSKLGNGEGELLSLVDKELLGAASGPPRGIAEVAESIGLWVQVLERADVGISLGGVDTTDGERNFDVLDSCIVRGLLNGGIASQYNEVSE